MIRLFESPRLTFHLSTELLEALVSLPRSSFGIVIDSETSSFDAGPVSWSNDLASRSERIAASCDLEVP